MTKDQNKEETLRRLREIDPDLARDEAEVERQLPNVHREMISDADKAADWFDRIAGESVEPRYRKKYADEAERQRERARGLRNILAG